MRIEVLMIILGMGIVTFLPRLLPVFLVEKIKLSKKMEKFLYLIPFTAMISLIFPKIIFVDSNRYIGVIGGVVAVFLSWKKFPIAVVIIGAIVAVMGIYYIN